MGVCSHKSKPNSQQPSQQTQSGDPLEEIHKKINGKPFPLNSPINSPHDNEAQKLKPTQPSQLSRQNSVRSRINSPPRGSVQNLAHSREKGDSPQISKNPDTPNSKADRMKTSNRSKFATRDANKLQIPKESANPQGSRLQAAVGNILAESRLSSPVASRPSQLSTVISISKLDLQSLLLQPVPITKVYTMLRKVPKTIDHLTTMWALQHNLSGEFRSVRAFPKESTKAVVKMILTNKLEHPNLIKLYEIYEDAQHTYILQEYCTGGTLEEHLAKQSSEMTDDTICMLMRQMFSVISYLHENCLVHGRLTLKSFSFVDQSPTSKLVLTDYTNLYVKSEINERSVQGLAPEHLALNSFSQKGDVWALGVIAYQLINAVTIFFEQEPILYVKEQLLNHFNLENLKAPIQCGDFLNAVLQPDPQKRPTSAEALELDWFVHHIQQTQLSDVKVLNQHEKIIKLSVFKRIILNLLVEQSLGEQDAEVANFCRELSHRSKPLNQDEVQAKLAKLLPTPSATMLAGALTIEGPMTAVDLRLSVVELKTVITELNIKKLFQQLDADNLSFLLPTMLSKKLMIPTDQIQGCIKLYPQSDATRGIRLETLKQMMYEIL